MLILASNQSPPQGARRIQGHGGRGAQRRSDADRDQRDFCIKSVPYVGVAKVFDFLHGDQTTVLQNNGLNLPLEGQSTTTTENTLRDGSRGAEGNLLARRSTRCGRQAPKDQMHIQDFSRGKLLRRLLHPAMDWISRPGSFLTFRHADLAGRLRTAGPRVM